MFEKFTIKNFKSITELELDLGQVNVIIGANGAGKSNILEAIAMIAANDQRKIDLNKLSQAGVRVARPDLMRNSFFGKKTIPNIEIGVSGYGHQNKYIISQEDDNFIMSPWKVEVTTIGNIPDLFRYAEFLAKLSGFEIYSPMIDLQCFRHSR